VNEGRGFGRSLRAVMERATDRHDAAPYWLALLVAALLVTPAGTPRPQTVAVFLLLIPLAAVSLRWRAAPVVILSLAAFGLYLRFQLFGTGFSGVLDTTMAAIGRFLAGGNPYGFGYDIPSAPGLPFPYGPLTLLWYLPFRGADPRRLELAVAVGILVVLALRGRPIGLAVYALAATLVSTSSDGSNDTSAGLFLLVALLVAQRAVLPGGALLAIASAFKPHLAAWLPALVWFGGLPAAAGFAGGFLATWGPALLAWGPASILESIRLAGAIHSTSFYSLGAVLELATGRRLSAEDVDRIRFPAGAIAALVTTPFVRSGATLVIAGTIVFLVTLFAAYWSTFAYFAAIAPVLCWHLDDWLGLGDRRVRWPGDPVGAITAQVDRRWPVRVGPAVMIGRRTTRAARGEEPG
jgi:hypothetical protein